MAVAGGWADRHPDPRRSASFHARSLIQPNHRDKRANPHVVPTPRDRYHGWAVTPDTAPGARVSHRWRLVATALGGGDGPAAAGGGGGRALSRDGAGPRGAE